MRVNINKFISSEQAGGILLLLCTIFSLAITNSFLSEQYLSLWHVNLGLSLLHWINDGLMAIFFLLVGLEIKRELTVGRLSDVKSAMIPVFAAIGGMLVPAIIYIYFNIGGFAFSGWAIPMATDIAFALGMISLLGKRVHIALKVLLVAIAIVDDLGAVMVIAFFYAEQINFLFLLGAGIVTFLLYMMNYYRVKRLQYFLAAGIILWFFIYKSGIHSTIAGVILAFFIPLDKKSEHNSMLHKLENKLHVPVSRFIMPLFALANTAIVINADMFDQIFEQDSSLGIIGGLVIGKPVGIILFTILAVKLKLGKLPMHTTWKGLFGVAILGGIGFTMSIFIATLAFNDQSLIEFSKLSIFVGSGIATIIGLIVLYISTMKRFKTQR